jgi:hypothetical protein
MKVRLHKISPTRHVFEAQLPDGTCSRNELDSRSFLRHDLMHWCVEHRANVHDALYGAIERSEPLPQLATATEPMQGDGGSFPVVEALVGMMQGAAARPVDPAVFAPFACDYLRTQGLEPPAYLDAAFVTAVLADWHRLYGQWQSLRIGGVLELVPPAGNPDVSPAAPAR